MFFLSSTMSQCTVCIAFSLSVKSGLCCESYRQNILNQGEREKGKLSIFWLPQQVIFIIQLRLRGTFQALNILCHVRMRRNRWSIRFKSYWNSKHHLNKGLISAPKGMRITFHVSSTWVKHVVNDDIRRGGTWNTSSCEATLNIN